MQPFDVTTLQAVVWDLQSHCLPSRFEQAYQWDRHTLSLGLRTLTGRCWLTLSWHPQAARLHLGEVPPKLADTFTFSKQLQALLKGLALVDVRSTDPWERVVDLQFALRPGAAAQWHLYLEIMGKYSNAILVNGSGEIVTAGHQVSHHQTRIRPVQTGAIYEPPPPLQGAIPRSSESFASWQERLSLIPGDLISQLLKTYRGVSSALARSLLIRAGLDGHCSTDRLSLQDWQALFHAWHHWLTSLENQRFQPTAMAQGYTVLGIPGEPVAANLQSFIHGYYQGQYDRQRFQQLQHQLRQRIKTLLTKAHHKAEGFRQRLGDATQAEQFRHWGDLLMANLGAWQPGLERLTLEDFTTGLPIDLPLNPEKNAVQNAQFFYKQHQKLKRSIEAIEPLLQEVTGTIAYLEQVETSLGSLDPYTGPGDLITLDEIRDELIQQNYLDGHQPQKRSQGKAHTAKPAQKQSQADFHHYQTPTGYEVLVGRNNRPNDYLSFHLATDYDLWFHTQEIPGSHVLLRLPPGEQPDQADLQYVANVSAYHSRARQSDQVPVVYTKPQWVYKPKGSPPGVVIYKQETVIWGNPLTLGPGAGSSGG